MADIDLDEEEERKRRSASATPEFTYDTIAADPWTAVYYAIPAAASPALVQHAYDTVWQCCNAATEPQPQRPAMNTPAPQPPQNGYDTVMQGRGAATARSSRR